MHAHNLSLGTIEFNEIDISDEIVATDGFHSSIGAIYRTAIQCNPSFRNRIAYACYLAEHRQLLSAFNELDELVQQADIATNSTRLAEIADVILEIEARFDDTASGRPSQLELLDSPDHWIDESHSHSPSATSRFSDLIHEVMDQIEIGRPTSLHSNQGSLRDIEYLVRSLSSHRIDCRSRLCGCGLLKLSRLCASHGFLELQAACVQQAIHCFQEVAAELGIPHQHSIDEVVLLAAPRG